jgi:hypothetical protein
MPKELASDLVKLSLFDVILYLDDSGSMAFEQGGERIDDLKLCVSMSLSSCLGGTSPITDFSEVVCLGPQHHVEGSVRHLPLRPGRYPGASFSPVLVPPPTVASPID